MSIQTLSPKLYEQLSIVLACTYALYLKTQNYHWHVSGENFKSLHETFEGQYNELAEAVDMLAERIVTLGKHAPATFKKLDDLSTLKDGESGKDSQAMIKELEADHNAVADQINKAIEIAKASNDEGTIQVLSERLAAHEKSAWMLRASEI